MEWIKATVIDPHNLVEVNEYLFFWMPGWIPWVSSVEDEDAEGTFDNEDLYWIKLPAFPE